MRKYQKNMKKTFVRGIVKKLKKLCEVLTRTRSKRELTISSMNVLYGGPSQGDLFGNLDKKSDSEVYPLNHAVVSDSREDMDDPFIGFVYGSPEFMTNEKSFSNFSSCFGVDDDKSTK